MHLGEMVESRYEFVEEQINARIRLVIVESKRIFITNKRWADVKNVKESLDGT